MGPKLVLIALANHASHTDGYCWLKADTIAGEAACSKRSVFSYMGALIRNGYVRRSPRRGEDGKQRANDYWLVLNREEKPWEWSGPADEERPEDQEDTPSYETQDVVVADLPHAQNAVGETPDDGLCNAVEKQESARGPRATVCTRERIEEPSKTKPEIDARARPPYTPRHYQAPPPAPPEIQGAVAGDKQAKQIFVFKNSKAGDAWREYKRKTTGIAWDLWRWHWIPDVGNREGWWFPSLFPPPIGPPPKPTWQQEIEEMPEDFK